MSLSLDTIKPAAQPKKSGRRGRGDGSNRGNYSGRGIKGQKARSGVSGLKLLGLKSLVSQTPKKRGFNSQRPKNQILSPGQINDNFKEGEEVSPARLQEKGLVKDQNRPVKILGNEELKLKKLHFKGIKLSKSVAEQVKKQGGKIE
ncbi:MAG TPA: uL15 family ribosomal protein [Patescibacteria group bacterium]|nr:uL15 family ribosomal protein [Patescibacteria group bacterium]